MNISKCTMNYSKRISYMCLIEDVFIEVLKNNPPTIILRNWKKWENLQFTDRELYYEEIQILQCQKTVDAALQIICCLLDCPPWDIGIMATSKGLVAGPLLIKTRNENVIDCSLAGGTLIPHLVFSSKTELRSTAKYVLLIEKDAAFQKLLSCDFLTKMNGSLLVTGKGFPDANTRILVRKLNQDLKLPVMALVDADPFGIAIMCIYKYGSANASHYSESLVTPNIKWLGVHPSDIQMYNMASLPLQQADLLKLQSLREKMNVTADKKLLKEIKIQLQSGRKAEIEAMCDISPVYLSDVYIPSKIINNQLY